MLHQNMKHQKGHKTGTLCMGDRFTPTKRNWRDPCPSASKMQPPPVSQEGGVGGYQIEPHSLLTLVGSATNINISQRMTPKQDILDSF